MGWRAGYGVLERFSEEWLFSRLKDTDNQELDWELQSDENERTGLIVQDILPLFDYG